MKKVLRLIISFFLSCPNGPFTLGGVVLGTEVILSLPLARFGKDEVQQEDSESRVKLTLPLLFSLAALRAAWLNFCGHPQAYWVPLA